MIKQALENAGWFQSPGAYVLVDGQYGSTGKGAVAALFGQLFGDRVNVVTTNAGPNSGHTGYYQVGGEWRKVITQQIPVMAVVAKALYPRDAPVAYLNAGAVVNPIILRGEASVHSFNYSNLVLHPNAAVIDYDYETDGATSTDNIASTNKGVGRALARKVMREANIVANRRQDVAYFSRINRHEWDWSRDVVFVETAQGFSLGVNQQFYPYCTSRECTVGQALADAAIPYNQVRKVAMVVRTFPIRVGNTDKGSSGDYYSDQHETSWGALGVEPEITTVTKRVRRVFTWSRDQFMDAVVTNQPDMIFLNFMNYLEEAKRGIFIKEMVADYETAMRREPEAVLLGYGPLPTEVKVWGAG